MLPRRTTVPHFTMRRALQALAMSVASLITGCGSSSDRINRFDGEWTIELASAQGLVPKAHRASGRVVFSEELPIYGERPPIPTAPYAVGRSYADLTPLLGERGSNRNGDPYFDPSPSADVFDEVYAWVDSTGALVMEIAPQVAGYEPLLRGHVFQDSIIGTWSLDGNGSPSLHGSFRMIRTRRTAVTDSAHIRAARAAERE
jgi:hypothetical protein